MSKGIPVTGRPITNAPRMALQVLKAMGLGIEIESNSFCALENDPRVRPVTATGVIFSSMADVSSFCLDHGVRLLINRRGRLAARLA